MPAMTPEEFSAALTRGVIALDLRAPHQWAPEHIPGSICLQFGRHDLADRAELFLSPAEAYAIIMDPAPLGPLAEELLKKGGFRILGHLKGGLDGWRRAGLPLSSVPVVPVADLPSLLAAGEHGLLDVREDYEFQWGHIPGSVHIPHGELADRVAELDPARPWLVICNDQVRSGAAVSVLLRRGLNGVSLVLGGTVGWGEAGHPLDKAQG